MGYDNVCNTGLVLGLGLESTTTTDINPSPRPRPKLPIISFEPSLTLALISGHERKIVFKADDDHQDSSSGANSSFSNPSLKREREGAAGSEEPESTEILVSAAAATRVISDDFEDEDDNNNNINSRKKLRLTKPQSALLEENFKHHTTLNPKQKQELARNLNLSPRQVEVWFQNRRARTKLKQTEVEHEYLKKCCETLTDENRRLQKELQELKALKLMQPPLYMQLPAATLTLCPSCETIGGPTDKSSKSPFVSKPHHHFYNPFTTHPSAAC